MKTQLTSVFDDQGRPARHLAAAAGGGRHGDQRRHGVGNAIAAPFDRRIARQPTRVRGGERRAFREIDGRTSTHGDQSVAIMVPVARRGGHDHGLGRVGGRVVEHGNVARAEHVQRALHKARRDDALVRDDQRAADTDPRAFRGQSGERIVAEVDVGQVVDVGHIRGRWVRSVCGTRSVAGRAIGALRLTAAGTCMASMGNPWLRPNGSMVAKLAGAQSPPRSSTRRHPHRLRVRPIC